MLKIPRVRNQHLPDPRRSSTLAYLSFSAVKPPTRPGCVQRSRIERTTILGLFACLILLCACARGAAIGIVIFTDPKHHTDQTAMAVEYQTAVRRGEDIEFTANNGRRYMVGKLRLRAVVPYPTRNSVARNGLEGEKKRLEGLVERYPQSGRFLHDYIYNISRSLAPASHSAQTGGGEHQSVSVKTTKGRSYSGCSLTKVADGRASIRHRDGTARIPIEELGKEARQALSKTSKEWHLLEPAWGPVDGVSGSKFLLLADGRRLNGVVFVKIEEENVILEVGGKKLRLALDDLPEPSAGLPFRKAFVAKRIEETDRAEQIETAQMISVSDWENESKLPLLSPYAALFLPREWVLSQVYPASSIRGKGVEAKFNRADAAIKGAGSPISGEQFLLITILRDVDEMDEEIHLVGKSSEVKEMFVRKMQKCPEFKISGHRYRLFSEVRGPGRPSSFDTDVSRLFSGTVDAMPENPELPVFKALIFGVTKKECDQLVEAYTKALSEAVIGSFDPERVVKNWEMLGEIQRVPSGLRPADDAVVEIFRNEELSDTQKLILLFQCYTVPLAGEPFDVALKRFDAHEDAVSGPYRFFHTLIGPISVLVPDGEGTRVVYLNSLSLVVMSSPRTGRVGAWQVTTFGLTSAQDVGVAKSREVTLEEFKSFADSLRSLISSMGGGRFEKTKTIPAGESVEDTIMWVTRGVEFWVSSAPKSIMKIDLGAKMLGDKEFTTEMGTLYISADCLAQVSEWKGNLMEARRRLIGGK